jgi:hypothetical protein
MNEKHPVKTAKYEQNRMISYKIDTHSVTIAGILRFVVSK